MSPPSAMLCNFVWRGASRLSAQLSKLCVIIPSATCGNTTAGRLRAGVITCHSLHVKHNLQRCFTHSWGGNARSAAVALESPHKRLQEAPNPVVFATSENDAFHPLNVKRAYLRHFLHGAMMTAPRRRSGRTLTTPEPCLVRIFLGDATRVFYMIPSMAPDLHVCLRGNESQMKQPRHAFADLLT